MNVRCSSTRHSLSPYPPPTHFRSTLGAAVLYNAKLHIDEGHHYGRPRTPHRHSKHGEKEEL